MYIFNTTPFYYADVTMAAGREKSFQRVGSLIRSKSEGTLIDLDDDATLTSNTLNGEYLILKMYLYVSL